MITIHNSETGEIITREMNAAEIAQIAADDAAAQARQEAAETKATEKAALLAKLGITADEAKLLLS
jgi:hypothetical protein